jgi:SET domain-containing protein
MGANELGVRTCRPIPKGMFICRYIGEVITEAEAEARGEEYDRKVLLHAHLKF